MIHAMLAAGLALLVTAPDGEQDKGPQEMQKKFEQRMKELEKRFQAERAKLEEEFRGSMERGPAPDDLGRAIRRLSERLDMLERRLEKGPMGGPPPGPRPELDRECPLPPPPPGMESGPRCGPCPKGKRGKGGDVRGKLQQLRKRFEECDGPERIRAFIQEHGKEIRAAVMRLGSGVASCHCKNCPVNVIREKIQKAVHAKGPDLRARVMRFLQDRRGPPRAERFRDDDDDEDRGPRREGGRRGHGRRDY